MTPELARYFMGMYKFSNEKEMAGVLRSGMLQKRIKKLVPGTIVEARHKGCYLHLTTEDKNVWRIFISEKCDPTLIGPDAAEQLTGVFAQHEPWNGGPPGGG